MSKITLYITIIILSFVTITSGAQEKKKWSLKNCIDYAYLHNLDLKHSENNITTGKYKLQQTKNNRLPSVNGSVSFNNNYGRSIDYQTNSYTTQNSSNLNYGVGASLDLFGGFSKVHEIKKADIDLQADLQDVAALKEDITLRITSYYLNILYAIEQLQVAKDNLAITQKEEEQTNSLVDAGKKTKGDLLEQKAQVTEKESIIVEAENKLSLSYLDLYQMLDIKGNETFEIDKPHLDILDKANVSLLNYVNQFDQIIAERPGVKAYDLRLKSAEEDIRIAKSAYYPSLKLSANIGSGYSNRIFYSKLNPANPSIPMQGGRMSFNDQYKANLSKTWGLTLSVPIFNKTQIRTNVKSARLQIDNLGIEQKQEQNKIYKELQQAYTNSTAAVKKYDAQQKTVTALKKSYHYAEEKYKLGMLSYYNFNEALNNLMEARSAMLQAKYEYVFRTKILEFYSTKQIEL